MKTRIIGLGNTLLTDDGVGICVAREATLRLADTAIDVVETEAAGFALLELMVGWDRVVLVDAIAFDGVVPGTIVPIDPADLRTSLRLRSVHEIDLPTVLGLGRAMGFDMPSEVRVFGIQVEDALTLGEHLTDTVRAVVPQAVDAVVAAATGA